MKDKENAPMSKPFLVITMVDINEEHAQVSLNIDARGEKVVAGFVMLMLQYPNLCKILKAAIKAYEIPVKLPKASDFYA